MSNDTAGGRPNPDPGKERSPATGSTGPMAGITVIDLTRALAGPHATMMFGDLGARVIKVETPDGGDDTRGWGPPFVQPPNGARESTYFLSANRNKQSIALDLKTDEGASTLRALVVEGDVLVENFRSGVLDRLGFSVEQLHALNPRLVILSITGFGHDGPDADRAGYDQIAQGEAGLMSVTGSGPDDPQKVGTPVADVLAGMYGAFGVLAALLQREQTGQGQVVRTSLLAAVIGVHAFQGTRWTVAGEVGRSAGNHHPSVCPYGLYACRDGSVQIAIGSEGLWRRFCAMFDMDPDRTGMTSNAERVANREAVNRIVEEVFASRSRDELLELFRAGQIPAGAVRDLAEVYTSPQVRSQGLVVHVDHATLGELSLPGPPLRFFDPASGDELTYRQHAAPPVLDAHGSAVREWLADRSPRPDA